MNTNDEVRCPLCDTEGWCSFARIDGYAAICGTAWTQYGRTVRQSEQCVLIAQLRMENALLRMGVEAV